MKRKPARSKARAAVAADVGLESAEPGYADGGRFIQSAIKHPGAFRAKAQAAGESTREYAEEHKHDSSTTGRQARLAITLMGMNRK